MLPSFDLALLTRAAPPGASVLIITLLFELRRFVVIITSGCIFGEGIGTGFSASDLTWSSTIAGLSRLIGANLLADF